LRYPGHGSPRAELRLSNCAAIANEVRPDTGKRELSAPHIGPVSNFRGINSGCSNQVKSFVGRNIRVEMSLPSSLGAQSSLGS